MGDLTRRQKRGQSNLAFEILLASPSGLFQTLNYSGPFFGIPDRFYRARNAPRRGCGVKPGNTTDRSVPPMRFSRTSDSTVR